MKALLVLGRPIIMQVVVLIRLHKRRQRFRQERGKCLTEFYDLQAKRAAEPHND